MARLTERLLAGRAPMRRGHEIDLGEGPRPRGVAQSGRFGGREGAAPRPVRKRTLAAGLALLLTLACALASPPAFGRTEGRGPVTNLPLPRFVSLKTSEGNARRGPSTAQRIDWVFVRRDMPLQVIGEYGHWRQVRDAEGASGWVHYALLSGVRTVLIAADMTPLRDGPEDNSLVAAYLETGVVARLGECEIDWCRLSVEGYRGWTRKASLWGVDADELRD